MITKKNRKSSIKTTKEMEVQIALGTLEPSNVLKALRSKKTSGDVIKILDKIDCEEDNWEKRELIYKHPNTPTSVLASVFQQRKFMEFPSHIVCEDATILVHPSFPVKLLREVFNKIKYDSRFWGIIEYSYLFKVIENPKFPTDLLESLANHKNITVRYLVAKHPNTPPKALELLSTSAIDLYWYPPEQVAANLNTPPLVLNTLSTSQRITTRNRVANNPKTPTDTLKAMITGDKSHRVRSIALHTLFKLGKITLPDE